MSGIAAPLLPVFLLFAAAFAAALLRKHLHGDFDRLNGSAFHGSGLLGEAHPDGGGTHRDGADTLGFRVPPHGDAGTGWMAAHLRWSRSNDRRCMRHYNGKLDWSREIVAFVTVAQTQSISGTARRLGLSVGHISQRLHALEERLGIALLVRTTRCVWLTDAGRSYLALAQHLLGYAAYMDRELVQAFRSDGSRKVGCAEPLPFVETIE